MDNTLYGYIRMVKIHIQIMIEDPTKEEWNQLVQLAQQGKGVINGLDAEPDLDVIVDNPVEETDESVSARALEDAKRAEELLEEEKKRKADEEAKEAKEAEKKAKAEKRRLKREADRRKKEAARVASIEKALETSRSLDEVYAMLKKNKVSFKRDEVKKMNNDLEESLPARTPMFSIDDEDLEILVKVSFAQHLIHVIKNKWFNKKWSLKGADGKAMLKHFMSEVADDQRYDPSYHDKVRQIICDIVDPAKNPQRGEMAGEAYVLDEDVYEYTPDWAHYVLTEEIIPMINQDNEDNDAPREFTDRTQMVMFKLKEWDATRKGKNRS